MHMQILTIGFGVIMAVVSPTATRAQDTTDQGDIDCKVILCLAGGFPNGCGDALSYMLDRISPPHPKPPFGVCPMSNGESYTAYDAPYARLSTNQPSGWDCGRRKNLFFARHPKDQGPDRIEAFCYTETQTISYREDGRNQTRTEYLGRSAATPVNFEIQITVEPNTAQAFTSPKYKMNYNTGYFREVSPGTTFLTPTEGG